MCTTWARTKESEEDRNAPSTLDEALDALEGDEIIKRALGEAMYESYAQ